GRAQVVSVTVLPPGDRAGTGPRPRHSFLRLSGKGRQRGRVPWCYTAHRESRLCRKSTGEAPAAQRPRREWQLPPLRGRRECVVQGAHRNAATCPFRDRPFAGTGVALRFRSGFRSLFPLFEEPAMYAFKPILHPTDFSAPSEYAFQLAASLARDHGAHLVILHVESPPLRLGQAMAVPPTPPGVYRDQVWEEFRRLTASDPRLREVFLQTELVEGEPSREILRLAREHPCHLIVI